MSATTSRRDFLTQSALAGFGFLAAGGLTAAPLRQPGANERVNIAVVGAGGRGVGNIGAVEKLANIVALCDVDDARAAATYRRFPKVPHWSDFRAMLDKQ